MAEKLFEDDRLNVHYDGSALCVIAVGAFGDTLDLGEHEVEDLICKLQTALAESRASGDAAIDVRDRRQADQWHDRQGQGHRKGDLEQNCCGR